MFDQDLRKYLQDSIDDSNDLVSRNKMGQYATPKTLAVEVSQYIDELQSWNYPIEVLEPALGLGVFIEAIEFHTNIHVNEYTGVELDNDFFNVAKTLWKDYSVNLINSDFMSFETDKKFQLIISNPPYVRHHHLDKSYKGKIQKLTRFTFNANISKLAGLYCYFLGKAHQFLAEDGISVWLIPSEFLDVNYGKVVKSYLLNKVDLIHIHKYNQDDNLFEDATVSSCVVIFRQKQANHSAIKFSYGGSISKPSFINKVDVSCIKAEDKWSNFFRKSQPRSTSFKTSIKDFFEVKRGLVTGSNSYFILGKEEIDKNRLEKKCLTPILPSPRYLPKDVIESYDTGSPIIENNKYVIQTALPLNEIRKKLPNLYDYLTSELSNEVKKGYICKNRKPWYNIGNHNAPLFICTYMGRVKDGNSPFRFILNNSNALIPNSMLGLYPSKNLAIEIANGKIAAIDLLKLLQSIDTETMISGSRVYGGGMHKIEPKELLKIPFNIPGVNSRKKELLLFEI